MTDLLDAGARRSLPRWATSVLLAAVALAAALWTVLVAAPVTLDGHGSQTYRVPGGTYQPLLGRPLK